MVARPTTPPGTQSAATVPCLALPCLALRIKETDSRSGRRNVRSDEVGNCCLRHRCVERSVRPVGDASGAQPSCGKLHPARCHVCRRRLSDDVAIVRDVISNRLAGDLSLPMMTGVGQRILAPRPTISPRGRTSDPLVHPCGEIVNIYARIPEQAQTSLAQGTTASR